MQVRLLAELFFFYCQFYLRLSFAVSGSIVSILFLSYSTELQKPCAGQPTICEVLEVVLKECRKESLVYKMAALRCAGDVLHSSQEDHFSDIAEILFPLIKKVQSYIYTYLLLSVCYYRHLKTLLCSEKHFNFVQSVFPIPNRAAQKAVVHHQGHWMRMMTEM